MEITLQSSRDVKRAWWAQALMESKRDRSETGITVAAWCKEHNVTEKSYWYYHKQLSNHLLQSAGEISDTNVPEPVARFIRNDPEFAELKEPAVMPASGKEGPAAILHTGSVIIEITNNASEKLLTDLIRAVSHV